MSVQSTTESPARSLAGKLRHARRSFGLSINDIAEDIKIRPDFLRAMEQGAFGRIEESVYRTLMVKTYTEYLGIDWGTVHDEYIRESLYTVSQKDGVNVNTGAVHRADLLVAPRLIKHVLLSAGMIAACFYLLVLAGSALQRPSLSVFNPPDNFSSASNTIRIEGKVSSNAVLSINGQEVVKDGDGRFAQDVMLSEGVNSIRISATKKYSKETAITRTVLYERPSLSYNK